MKELNSKELIKWFDEEGDVCPYCLYYLDFQMTEGSKSDPTTDYYAHCSCSDTLMWSQTIKNPEDKLIFVERVC